MTFTFTKTTRGRNLISAIFIHQFDIKYLWLIPNHYFFCILWSSTLWPWLTHIQISTLSLKILYTWWREIMSFFYFSEQLSWIQPIFQEMYWFLTLKSYFFNIWIYSLSRNTRKFDIGAYQFFSPMSHFICTWPYIYIYIYTYIHSESYIYIYIHIYIYI